MKKIISIAAAVLSISVTVNAKTTDTSRLREYYRLIHRASIFTWRGDLDSAKGTYNSAFSLTDYPYFVDLNNAIYVEINSKSPDTSKIISYLKMIQKKGICIHDHYKNKQKFHPYVSLLNEEGCNSVVDTFARARILKATADDQKVRNDPRGTANAIVRGKMQRMDAINYVTIIEILRISEEKDVPLENLVGWEGYWTSFVILQHHASWRKGKFAKPYLEKLTKNGTLEARYTASEFDYFSMFGFLGTKTGETCEQFDIYGTTLLTLTYSGALLKVPSSNCYKTINGRRSQLYLSDVMEEAKIRTFAFFNTKNGYKFPGINVAAMTKEEANQLEMKLRLKNKIIKYAGREDFDFNRER